MSAVFVHADDMYFPAPHVVEQFVQEAAPAADHVLPAVHDEQEAAPAAEYFPASQFVHEVAPAAEYVPAEHGVHVGVLLELS